MLPMAATEVSVCCTQFTLHIGDFTTLYVGAGTNQHLRRSGFIHPSYWVAGNTVFHIKVQIFDPIQNHITLPTGVPDFSKKKRASGEKWAVSFHFSNARNKNRRPARL